MLLRFINQFLNEEDDGDRTRWRLTRLGKLTVLCLAGLLLMGLSTLLIPDRQSPASKSPAAVTPRPQQAARILTTADALDFVVVAYGNYIDGIEKEAAATRQLAPPFDLTVALRRVEYIRPDLSPSLYKRVRATYTEAAKVGTIDRDELFCGLPTVTGVRPSLQQAGRDVASVRVEKYVDAKAVGSFTVTVDLKGRALAEITCQ